MKKYLILLLIMIAYCDCSAQINLESLFEGGKAGFEKYMGKTIRYKEESYLNGRYGLCLLRLTLNRKDTLSKINILSSPSKGISTEVLRAMYMWKNRWRFPVGIGEDSIYVIIGFYFIRGCYDDNRGVISGKPVLDYPQLKKEYDESEFYNEKLEAFDIPVIYLGIMEIISYCSMAVE